MGVARKVIEGYVGVSGVARKFWAWKYKLSDLPIGSRIYYVNEYYTLIDKDYERTGDAILWKEKVTAVANDAEAYTMLTPFGASNTNQINVRYNLAKSSGNYQEEITGCWGWVLPTLTLNRTDAPKPSYGFHAMSYFSSDARRVRSNTYKCKDVVRYNSKYYFYEVTATGAFKTSYSSTASPASRLGGNRCYAFSVKGTCVCEKNTDGSYTLVL